MSEFIEVIDALKELNELLKQKQSPRPLRFWALEYDLLELPLYVSDDGVEIQKAGEKEKNLYYDSIFANLSKPFILKGIKIEKAETLNLSLAELNEIILNMRYYWKADDFYRNPIFKVLETNEELQNKLEQAHARIAELEKQLQGNQLENPLFVLGAIMQTIKQVGRANYTQASHYQFIIDNYESMGLSQSNFEKTVSHAKTIFLQKANKKSK